MVSSSLEARELGGREERERIQQDIHDDLGAKLLTLLHQVPSAQQGLVRESIRDMRQLLRTLDGHSESLETVLERIYIECRERTGLENVALKWQQSLDKVECELLAPTINQLEKIMREATTNALKQEHCTELTVDVSVKQGRLLVEIVNDGCVTTELHLRRGLRIMQKRVEQTQGELSWQPEPPYWRLIFNMPLDPSTVLAWRHANPTSVGLRKC